MDDVAIFGAGELGGTLAHVLARRDVVRRIRLIDPAGQIAAGKALDIMQASPIDRFSTVVSGSTDLVTAGGSTIMVVADRAARASNEPGASGNDDWSGDEGVLLLKQLSGIARQCVVVCAGARQRELVDRGVRELKWPRERLLGSAPEALAAAVRAIVAIETNGSSKDVALTVLGVPPTQTVIPWEDVTIAGFAATRVLDEPSRRRIAARIAALWPPGPYALAAAAAEVVAGITGNSRRTLSCFVAPKHEARASRTAAMPARLGPGGVESVELPPLDGNARTALANAIELWNLVN
jgi:malate dehydrogenase